MFSPKLVMKSLFFIFSLYLLAVGLSASPVPYSGKVSIDGVNFTGTADFRFELRDENGTVHWRNAQNPATSISVPVQNGRYVVLLGGQGMLGLPSLLFVQYPKLWVRVQVDFRDGQGPRLLQPDQRVHSVPHALSANLAKRALSADSVADQGVSARSFDPALKAYLAPLLASGHGLGFQPGSLGGLDRDPKRTLCDGAEPELPMEKGRQLSSGGYGPGLGLFPAPTYRRRKL